MSEHAGSFKVSICIFVLAVTFLSFSSVLKNDFTNWDDTTHLTENPNVRTLDFKNIVRIFTGTVNQTYIPLTTLSFAVEHHFFKWNPFVYHLNNLLLHLAVTALVYVFAVNCGLSVMAAGLAALLFGIHPMHVESVAWVTERKDILYSFFYLLSLLNYWLYLEKSNKVSYVFSVFCALLSILAKPMALSLPLILFVCDWFRERKFTARIFKEKIPYFLLIVPIAWITYSLNARSPEIHFPQAVLIWFWTFSFYIQKFVFPAGLVPLYGLPQPVSLGNIPYALSWVTLVLIAAAVVRFKNNRWFVFAWLYFFVSIFFLLRFDDAVDRSIVADRFMYLPSLGFCLFFGFFLEKIFSKAKEKGVTLKWVTGLCIFVLFANLAVKTYRQGMVWKDSKTLWNYVIDRYPQSIVAHLNRGHYYRELEDFDKALTDYNRVLDIDPAYIKALYNRGNVYVALKDYQSALADYNRALAIKENYKVYFYRAELYRDIGHYDMALADYGKCLIMEPAYAEAYHNRGAVYGTQGQYGLAIEDFTRAIELNPNYETAYFNRSITYFTLNQFYQAYQDAVRAKALGYPVDEKYLLKLQVSTEGRLFK